MTIQITQKPEQNVVNVGDEINIDQLEAIQNANTPSSTNPFVTTSDAQKSVFREAVLFNTFESPVATITINSQDFANGFTRDVVGEALAVNNDGFGVTQKFIIFLKAPTQGISMPTVNINLYNGDTSAVRAGTAVKVGEFSPELKYSTYAGELARYEWTFELTPTGMANPVRIFPDVYFTTADSEEGDWEFTFVWEASIPV